MAKDARAVVEAALRARKLDRTLTTAGPAPPRAGGRSVDGVRSVDGGPAAAATGVVHLDECLQGGLPRGQLSEITGPCSSGRTTLLLHLLAAATGRGEIVALIDTVDCLDVAAAAAAGVDLDRLLWIRGHAVDRALKALNLVLQAGGFGVVAIDLADAPPAAVHRIPLTTWLRVQRTLEGSETTCVIVASRPLARSAGGVTLLVAGGPRWAGGSARSRRLAGLDLAVRVVSPRRRVEGDVTITAMAAQAGIAQAEACALQVTVARGR